MTLFLLYTNLHENMFLLRKIAKNYKKLFKLNRIVALVHTQTTFYAFYWTDLLFYDKVLI